MGDKDTVLKQFLSDNDRFAQLCNNTLFDGKPIISPEKLKDVDTTLSESIPLGDETITNIQQSRDVAKIYDDQLELLILGIENQNDIHYAMPLRTLVYDALTYNKQYREKAKVHRTTGDLKNAERLSGFSKDDRLVPVITLVVYYGIEPWDGPTSLNGMLSIPEQLKPWSHLFSDHPMHLLEAAKIQNLENYQGDLKALFNIKTKCRHYGNLSTAINPFSAASPGMPLTP